MFVSKNCLFKSTLFLYQQQQKKQQNRTVSCLLFNECFIKPVFFGTESEAEAEEGHCEGFCSMLEKVSPFE